MNTAWELSGLADTGYADYVRGRVKGMDFARQARFPQFEDRQPPCPDGPVTAAWLTGFAEGILALREDGDPGVART